MIDMRHTEIFSQSIYCNTGVKPHSSKDHNHISFEILSQHRNLKTRHENILRLNDNLLKLGIIQSDIIAAINRTH